MLQSLYIENVAVIERAELQFGPGFTVLTGETGAGKSIIIDAIGAILGLRTSREVVRTGADKAFVSAVFTGISARTEGVLAELGLAAEGGELAITREIHPDGRTVCRIGGRPATVSALRALGETLVDIHGQSDSRMLTAPELHLQFLDGFGGNGEPLEEYQSAYRRYRAIEEERASLRTDENEKNRLIDLLQYQIREIEAADLQPGEEEDLLAQRTIAQNAAQIIEALSQAHGALAGGEYEGGAAAAAETASAALQGALRFMPALGDQASKLRDIAFDLQGLSDDLRDALESIEFQPAELDRIEGRLDLLYRLKSKYGGSVDEVLAYLESCRDKLSTITHAGERLTELERQSAEALAEVMAKGAALSERRRAAASEFARRMKEELLFLDMPSVDFAVSHEGIPPGPDGLDRMEFYISVNAGEPPKPIAKIASGGELSRIMLALKNIVADRDVVSTMIFDEVDTGVSGRAAGKVAGKLRAVSGGRQVICVTHLAIIAAAADEHLSVRKTERGGRTYTEVETLTGDARLRELARILRGDDITDAALATAREMLEQAVR